MRTAAVTAVTALFLGAGASPALAVPGDVSHAEGQFLSGSLLGLDAGLVASLNGEIATSDGTADVTNANNLDLSALGLVNIAVGGGVQVPLSLANAGVVSQYASALSDASSVGASGLVAGDGVIGTGVIPAPGVAPGPLNVNLGQVVGSLGLPGITELANLDLSVGAVSGRAAQAAPGAASGSYEIADAALSFDSPTVAALVGTINTTVAALQGTVNGLDASLTTSITSGLPVSVNLAVSTPDLAAAVAGLTMAPLTDPAFPGVTIDLQTGSVTVDLDQITALNGLPANTSILTPAVINTISANVLGVLTGLTTSIETALLTAVNGITIIGSLDIFGPVVSINTTAGALLAGNLGGLSLLGGFLPIDLPFLGTLLSAPLTALTTAVNALSDTVLAPVLSTLLPALEPVLSAALTLTVNNQSTAAGVFTETALRVTVLPIASALTLDLGTGRVGINAANTAPVITGLAPDNGPQTGGTGVTITGTGFIDATDVTIDGASVAFTVVDDTSIILTTPVHLPGPVPVVVTDTIGSSPAYTFTFTPVTQVIDVDPDAGPETGTNTVTITGQCFTGATDVLFGATSATSFTVVDDTTITAVVPAGTGVVDVTVIGAGTCGTGTLPDGYAYLPAAVLTSMTPTEGPESGGTLVTLTGTGFTNATDVTFDGISATDVTVVSDTEITAVSPAHVPSTVGVIVLSPGGDSAPAEFTYLELPTAEALTPDNGPEVGGTTVTITGSGFTDATLVTIDGVSVPFVIESDTEITFTTPVHVPATVPVVVTTAVGSSGPLEFEFTPVTTVVTIDPDSGPEAGGTSVTITGWCFTGATAVLFGGVAATSFTVVDDSTITAVAPAGVGTVDVTVVGSATCGTGELTDGFEYVPAAVIVTPAAAANAGGDLASTGFNGTLAAGFSVLVLLLGAALLTIRGRKLHLLS